MAVAVTGNNSPAEGVPVITYYSNTRVAKYTLYDITLHLSVGTFYHPLTANFRDYFFYTARLQMHCRLNTLLANDNLK